MLFLGSVTSQANSLLRRQVVFKVLNISPVVLHLFTERCVLFAAITLGKVGRATPSAERGVPATQCLSSAPTRHSQPKSHTLHL